MNIKETLRALKGLPKLDITAEATPYDFMEQDGTPVKPAAKPSLVIRGLDVVLEAIDKFTDPGIRYKGK